MFIALNSISAPCAPLLKEESYPLFLNLFTNIKCPRFFHWTSLWTTFSTNNDPINSIQIELAKIFYQWLA